MTLKKSVFYIFTICISVFVLAACGSDSESGDSNVSEEEKEVLQMVTAATFPPFEFTDTESGDEEIQGLDIDIAKHITEQLDVEFEIDNLSFSSIIGALKEGRADFSLTGMTATAERAESVDFTDPYFKPREAIIWKADESEGFSKTEELEGKKVASSIGSMQADKMNEAKGVELTEMDGNTAVAKEVLSGRVDAGFMVSTQAESFLETNPGLEMEMVEQDPEDDLGFAIVLPKDSEWTEPFNEELNKMMDDGTLDSLIEEWLGAEYLE